MIEEQIHIICQQYKITNYTINDDMSINVDGDVDLWNEGLKKIPLKFRKVSGWFDCGSNKLTSLEGSPIEVGGYFYCDQNELISLKGCAIKVSGSFHCGSNRLTSFEGGPKFIGGVLCCDHNPIFEEFRDKFNLDYNLYMKYIHREKILKGILND